MPYGIIKVDTVTFTDNGVDKNISLSGLVQNPTFTGNVTATGTISGDVIRGGTTVSGATVTGTTANFVSGVFTTQVSGVTITGTTVAATTGNFTSLTGTTATFTSGIIASGTGALTFNGQSDLRFADADSSHYIALQAPATITSNVTMTLPAADGTNGQVLTTNGAGTLSFTTASGGASQWTTTGSDIYYTTGKVLVGTTTARLSANGVSAGFQVEGLGNDGALSIIRDGGIAYLTLGRSGGASIGSNTAISNNDELGRISWAAADGTDIQSWAAQISAEIDGTPGSNDTPGRLVFLTTADGASTPTERLRITSAGLVGIGTTSPTTGKLTLVSDIDPGTTAAGIAVSLTGVGGGTATSQYGIRVTGGGYNNSTNVYGVHSALTQQYTSPTYGGYFSASSVYAQGYGVYAETTCSNPVTGGSSYAGYFKINCSAAGANYNNVGVRIENAATTGSLSQGLYVSTVSGPTTVIPFQVDHAGSEKLRIDSSGRLLVGTSTSDAQRLASVQIASAGGQSGWGSSLSLTEFGTSYNPYLVLQRSRNGTIGSHTVLQNGDHIGGIAFNGSDGDSFESAATINAFVDGTPGAADMPGRLVFSTTADGSASPTERMRIKSDGSFYFKTGGNVPSASTFGSSYGYAGGYYWSNAVATTGSEYHWAFINPNGEVGKITTNGSATSYTTSSDYRLKENVTTVTDGIIRLQQLKPSRFNFIVEPSKTVDGFLAHEVQSVVPEAITGEKDAIDDDGNPVYQGIDQSKLVPLLTAALQEAVAEIKALKDRVTALEAA